MTAAAFVFALVSGGHVAHACYPCDVETNQTQEQILEDYIHDQHKDTQENINDHTDDQFKKHEDWMVNTYFKDYILPAMMKMAQEMSSVAMQQMEILGTFLDAKQQLETERLYQQLAAQAHKDYQPSEGMCTIGTLGRSLEEADRTGELTAYTLARRSIGRQLLRANSLGTEGAPASDAVSRVNEFVSTYCNKTDNDKELSSLCKAGIDPARTNRDVDFARTLWEPMTVPINFSSGSGASAAEKEANEDVLALKTNLYANEILRTPVPAGLLYESATAATGSNAARLQAFLDLRAIVAKRGVAEETFDTIAGMKAAGTTDAAQTAKYLQAAIKQLNPGMAAADAQNIIGKNPSYWAQMEVLTHKILQDPQFYTDLYDKPANVQRKRVALEAIDLIQERDNYKVALRSEMLWSLLLEMQLDREQERVQNEADRMK